MKTALVTGGASGIGRAIADRLRADGNHVATIDLAQGDTDFSYVADVTDRDQIDTALDAVRTTLGPITILVNSAGLTSFRRFTNLTSQEWSKVVDVNLNGVFHVTQAVLPDMLEAGWGRIVNISSSSTHSGAPYMAPSVAAKSAVNGLTKTLALELSRMNRRSIVLALHPGTTDTALSKPFQGNVAAEKLFTPEYAATALLHVIAQRQPSDSGGFYAWDGATIGW